MKLYGFELSTYVAKVQVVLRHKNLEYTLVAPPDGYNSKAYREISPLGSIPALDHDGTVISESEAIIEYIDELYPSPGVLPGSALDRARARMLSRVHDTWVEPHIRALYPLAKSGRFDEGDGHIDNFFMRLERFCEVATPAPFIAGAELTVADCAWPTSFVHAARLLPMFGRELVIPESLRAWKAMLDTHRAAAQVRDRCDQAMQDWLKSLT